MAASIARGARGEGGIETARLRPVVRADLMRIGPHRDGGYVIPADVVRASTHLLALGLGDDWQFEAEFARINPHVRIPGADFWFFGWRTPGGRATRPGRRHRHLRRMVGSDSTPATVTIASLLDSLGTGRPHGAFLKVDVEGAEYGLTDAIVSHASAI